MHQLYQGLSQRKIRLLIIGCGGNGSAIAGGLPYLDQALRAWGHQGLDVTLCDGERISATNCVRQPFSRAEIGMFKSTVIAGRTNAFWGLNWSAVTKHYTGALQGVPSPDFVIGCVDSRKARHSISGAFTKGEFPYWLDLGNKASVGQFVLGYDGRPTANGRGAPGSLPSVAKLMPEICDAALDEDDDEPSCSAAEAIERQEPFVNQVIAGHALALLTRLLRHGEISHHGGFISLESGTCSPIPIDPAYWKRLRRAA